MSGASHEAARPGWIRALDFVSLLIFGVLWLALARESGLRHSAGELWVAFALGIPLGLLIADFASGFVHWLADTFFEVSTPVLGRALIHPFREHHDDPLAITRHGFLEVSGNNALVTIPLLGAALWWDGDGLLAALLAALSLMTSLAALLTNQIHKWAHAPQVASPVRWLQRRRLILSPEHHAAHHAPPHEGRYCVTVGWLNPWLDRLGVFTGIEAAVRRWQVQR